VNKNKKYLILFTAITSILSVAVFSLIKPTFTKSSSLCGVGSGYCNDSQGRYFKDINNNSVYDEGIDQLVEATSTPETQITPFPTPTLTPNPVVLSSQTSAPTPQPTSHTQQCRTVCVQEKTICN
jgi:hypothetical protein